MVLKAEPIMKAVAKTVRQPDKKKAKIILFSPAGKQFDNKAASQLAKGNGQLVLVCGRYEGIDERLKKSASRFGIQIAEISVGPYVLTGGELAAMVLIDAVSRQIPSFGKANLWKKSVSASAFRLIRGLKFSAGKGKNIRCRKFCSPATQGNREWRKKRAG